MYFNSYSIKEENDAKIVLSSLKTVRDMVDQCLNNITIWLGTDEDGKGFSNKSDFLQMLNQFRIQIGVSVTNCNISLWY